MHFTQSQKSKLSGLLNEFALRGDGRWACDLHFKLACVIGVAIGLLISSDVLIMEDGQLWKTLLLIILISPVFEELLFRGFVQGKLLSFDWGSKHVFGCTRANVVCSLLFTTLHFTSHAPLWALGVLFPSLLFGYFRDRHNSVYPSVTLHVLYNAVYFIPAVVSSSIHF